MITYLFWADYGPFYYIFQLNKEIYFGLCLIGELKVNVFGKVEKRFVNGESDSITYFYQMLKKQLSDPIV